MFRPLNQDSAKTQAKEQIDQNLKRVYDEVLKEAVPDRFKDLLAQLRAQDEKGRTS